MITIQTQFLALKIILNVTKNTDKTKIDYNCNRKQYLDFINHKRKCPLHGNSITAFKTIYQEIMLRSIKVQTFTITHSVLYYRNKGEI